MIISSINCNKRLNNLSTKLSIQTWLKNNNVDLLFVQEPWKEVNAKSSLLPCYIALGGNDKVFVWRKKDYLFNIPTLLADWLLCIKLDYLTVFNVYLDAKNSKKRVEQLVFLKEQIAQLGDKPVLLCGDFNIAPSVEDGLFGDDYSRFNTAKERKYFNYLISEGKLIDTTNRKNIGDQQYTIEKFTNSKKLKFRCDLCLISDYFYECRNILVRYDHTVRNKQGFTDHSALIMNVPITLKKTSDKSSSHVIDFEYKPHNTATRNRGPSKIARQVVGGLFKDVLGEKIRILDYGCGKGKDLYYYRESGFYAEGYDPYEDFGFNQKPTGLFDLICITFVLNVLPNVWERLLVIQQASEYLEDNGLMIITVRSESEIQKEAKSNCWEVHNDGYWSSKDKKTFQKGLTYKELECLIKRAHLSTHPITSLINCEKEISLIVACKQKLNRNICD
jgi:SAM-dependent methyltransferase